MFNCYDNWISIRGGAGGRTFMQGINNGRVTMSGSDERGNPFQHIVLYQNGKIADRKIKEGGRTVYHIVYGSYEKLGNQVIRFRKGTKEGRHGKARSKEMLWGKEGVCHSWYSHGRLLRQKFIYDNGKTAYNYSCSNKPFTIRNVEGKEVYEVKGQISGAIQNMINGSHSVIGDKMENWFKEFTPFEVKKLGKVIYKGQFENRQRAGEWIEQGLSYYFERGVAIPKEYFGVPVEKLDVLKILKLPNAQLRMALMSKIDPQRIAKLGKVVHKENEMRLYDIKNYDVRILRVQCPSTKSYYYLRVPKDSKKCEQARQWTFGVGGSFNEPIKFAVET